MVQVYIFPDYLNACSNSWSARYNHWGYASTPNGIVYGILSPQNSYVSPNNYLSFAEFVFIPSTYTYNGTTYYTYDVGVKQSYTLLTYPSTNPQIYDNVVYYASGSYIYGYDLILGSIIGSVLSSIMPSIIDTRDGMIFSFNASTIFYTSLQYPLLNSLASWSSVITPYNFNNGYFNYPAIVANGSLYINISGNSELVANANNPNQYTVVNIPAAPSSQYNGSLYAISPVSNAIREVYIYNSALNVVDSYYIPNFYNWKLVPFPYIIAMTSDYTLISNYSAGLSKTDIYNIVTGSIIALYSFYNDIGEVSYSNKYGVYLINICPLTILVPDNPLAVDVYTSQYAYNKIYIIASVSIANTVPVSSYLVRFYYSSIPNYDYYIGFGYKATVYGAAHLHDVLQYIGSSYTNASGLASILFTLPNANQKLYYYVEVEQGV